MWKGGIPSCSWSALAGWKNHKAVRYKQHHGGTLVTRTVERCNEKHPFRNKIIRNQIVADIYKIHLRKGIGPRVMSPRSLEELAALKQKREALYVFPAGAVSLRAPHRTVRSCSWTKTASVHPPLNLPPQKHWNLTPDSSRGPPPLSGPAPFPHSHWRTPCLLLKVWR